MEFLLRMGADVELLVIVKAKLHFLLLLMKLPGKPGFGGVFVIRSPQANCGGNWIRVPSKIGVAA